MAKKKDGLLYYGLRFPAPPKENAEKFEREWMRWTTGQGAADSGIDKTANEWDCWVELKTDAELAAFSKFIERALRGTIRWQDAGDRRINYVGKLELLN